MKFYFFFIFFFSFLGWSQKNTIDFKAIKKEITAEKSHYNYDKLIFKYKVYPNSLDTTEAQYLYYARNFKKDWVFTTDDRFKKLAEDFKNQRFENCILEGKKLYHLDPTNLDILLILLRAYDSQKDEPNLMLHLSQLRLLIEAIKSSGSGKSEHSPYLVNSVGDEYILLNSLNIGGDYTRTSKSLQNGILDIWTKENTSMYIKVLYIN